MENELRERPIILETEPSWVAKVPLLKEKLIIPTPWGEEPTEESRSQRFLAMNIIAEEPHVLFV
ncbi:hypothetical protein HD806DRAFT_497674 [Xylariaceae sp. AK1471]|nr:hypothetical protein HD806DRAFT_497674 [Xylariaceae sp. AK1471]